MFVKSNCRICICNCGTEVNIDDNNVEGVRGDLDSFSNGFICKKSISYAQHIKKNREFKIPLLRNSKGELIESSWEEAIDYAADKLKRIIENHGGKSVYFHSGENYDNTDVSDMAKLFLNAIGSPNYSDSGSYCNLARDMANRLTHGYASTKSDFKNSKAIILWGSNPRSSTPRFAKEIEDAKSAGAVTVVIDPMENNLAQNADLYLQIRPGSDGALALGIINILLKRGVVDEKYWSENSLGFVELKEYVEKFDLRTVEMITWIEGRDIEKLADIYENSESLCSSIGVAIELQTNAVQSIRSIVSLDVLAGFYNKKGCNISYKDFSIKGIEINSNEKPLGFDEFPLLYEFYGIAQVNRLTRSILKSEPYQVKALMVHNSNPALSLPNTNEVLEALKKLDLLIVTDNRITETTELADIVLPMTNIYERVSLRPLETDDAVYMKFCDRVVTPEIMTESEFFIKLAEKLDLINSMPLKSDYDIIDFKLRSIGSKLEEAKANPIIKVSEYNLTNIFGTDSGKAEFKSTVLSENGYPALPEFTEPVESMMTSSVNPEFIFTATTGARAAGAEIMDDGTKQKVAQAHKAVLNKFHKHDGDLVTISSPRGSIEMIIRESDRICPNTISIPQSTSDQNPNILVDNESLDPIIGYPGCRSFLIKLDHEH